MLRRTHHRSWSRSLAGCAEEAAGLVAGLELLGVALPGHLALGEDVAEVGQLEGVGEVLLDEDDRASLVAQRTVPVHDDDDETSLHERIKVEERAMLVDVVGRMAREGWTVTGRKVTVP